MATKTEARRAALHDRLIDIAEARIAERGLSELRARDLAQEAGCSVGAIYNVFDDLTALIMAVNGRTFLRLGAAVRGSFDGSETPTQRLVAMSAAYFRFAESNARLWRALFDLKMAEDDPVPEWYRAALDELFALIAAPVGRLFPDLPEDEHWLMTRALFSSVHGIVLLGLENRISGVPPKDVERMIEQVLTLVAQNKG